MGGGEREEGAEKGTKSTKKVEPGREENREESEGGEFKKINLRKLRESKLRRS